MKSIIVYFSQTENTKKIAQAICLGMKRILEECEITSIKNVKPDCLSSYDLIGLGSPIWRFRAPPNVQAFVNGLSNVKGKLCFVFFTHGCTPCGFMQRTAPALERKGLRLIGYHDWYGSCFLGYIPKPYITDGHPDSLDLKEAETFGNQMSALGQRITNGETNLIPKLPQGIEWHKIYGKPPPMPGEDTSEDHQMSAQTEVTDEDRWIAERIKMNAEAKRNVKTQMKINMRKCKYPSCRLCIENCPMSALDFSVTPPVIKKTCAADFFCELICPQGAIEIDYEMVSKLHDVLVKRWFINTTNNDEAKGRFRRLVPLEKIGWNNHQYEITGHPRFVINE